MNRKMLSIMVFLIFSILPSLSSANLAYLQMMKNMLELSANKKSIEEFDADNIALLKKINMSLKRQIEYAKRNNTIEKIVKEEMIRDLTSRSKELELNIIELEVISNKRNIKKIKKELFELKGKLKTEKSGETKIHWSN